MKNILKISLVLGSLFFLSVSCETGELDLLTSPNDITEDSADPTFVLNDIQLKFIDGYEGLNQLSMQLTAHVNLFGSYNGAVDGLTLSGDTGEWATFYQMFANIDLLEDIAGATESGLTNHVALAQIIEAYTYMILVDYVGDVPFSEANNPEEFPNPSVDDGRTIYEAQIALLDEAIANLNIGANQLPEDLFFGTFVAQNWIQVANTLKLRAYVNIGKVDAAAGSAGISAVLSTGNYINENTEDFEFKYSNAAAPVDSRHPLFSTNYLAAGGAVYVSNNMLDLLNAGDDQPPFVETGIPDPRLRYYVYRQRDQAPSGSNLPCDGDGNYFYCYVGNKYWGRDRNDESGIPNDGIRRSLYGIYPIGGAFDKDEFVRGVAAPSLGGQGIQPLYLASYTYFALAESALRIGSGGGTPVSLMEQGIRLNMDKVKNFAPSSSTGTFAMTQADIDAYVGRVLAEYNAADANGKLAVISREFYLATYGCGPEVYNLYRRTGYPDLQSPVSAAGPFPRSFRYPDDEVINNPNISQKPNTDQVFWDNNPTGFID